MSETKYEVRDAVRADADIIAPTMRQVDRDELAASSGVDPLRVLRMSIRASEVCRVGLADDIPACIFGVSKATIVSDTGSIWMLGTDILQYHSIPFLKRNKAEIREMSIGLKRLDNYCDARNTPTLRWLRWLGFTIEKAKPYGVRGLPFHYFWKDV